MDNIISFITVNIYLSFFLFLLYRVILGYIAMMIYRYKGFKNGGFFWGFFLGVIGWIIILLLPSMYEIRTEKSIRYIAEVLGEKYAQDDGNPEMPSI